MFNLFGKKESKDEYIHKQLKEITAEKITKVELIHAQSMYDMLGSLNKMGKDEFIAFTIFALLAYKLEKEKSND